MSVYLVTRTTSRVEHLSVWAYDRETDQAWSTGRHVPICGQERHHGPWTITESTASDVAYARHRKRICSRCVVLLDRMRLLALGLRPELDDELPLDEDDPSLSPDPLTPASDGNSV